MNISQKQYAEMAKKASPRSKKLKDFTLAFLVGGVICTIGQLLRAFYISLNLPEQVVKAAVPVSIIFMAALLTGLGIFEKIAKHAGAGTLVPITGFANAVVSPAIEFKTEGHVLGIGVKMFTVAGPVILFGTFASVVYGLIYWVLSML